MAVTPDGWLSWAERDPGPPDKKYTEPCLSAGYVPHSAVGYYGGWRSRLDSTDRLPNGRYTDYAAASVTGWIAYDGTVIQQYPFTVSCWASGNRHANTSFNAFENEGGFDPTDEPLTTQQVRANVRIIQELSAWKGWTPQRMVTLLEHNECVALWGGGATSCPSNRIPWATILAALNTTPQEDDDMAAIIRKPGTPENYLVRGKTLEFLPSKQVRLDIAEAYGIDPAPTIVTVETWDWLGQQAG